LGGATRGPRCGLKLGSVLMRVQMLALCLVTWIEDAAPTLVLAIQLFVL
jgi:hypothetical protein